MNKTQRWAKSEPFFPKIRALFWFSKKDRGAPPPQLCTWRKMKIGDYLSTYVTKIHVSGSAFCIYCNKPLVSGNTGKKGLFKHATKSTEHLSSKENTSHQVRLVPVLPWHMPYVVAENVHTTATCPLLKENILRRYLVFQIINITLKLMYYLLSQKIHYCYQSSLS